MDNKTFNVIITGVGGQGLITLIQVIDEAALIQGYHVRSSELHGLSQRGGSVEAHIRFGKIVNSPMVLNGTADLVISLEMLEAIREFSKAGKNTKFLVNKYSFPFPGSLSQQELEKRLLEIPKDNLYLVPAAERCKEALQNEVVSTLYLLGYAVQKGLIPLKKESVLKAIENVIPEKYQELNIKAFNLPND